MSQFLIRLLGRRAQSSEADLGRLRLDPSGYQRILIIATRQIGDVLCTTPLMRRAREIWPSATIDVLGYEKTMGMLKGNPDINDVIESSEHPRWPEYKQLLKRIFRQYDLAIVTQPSDRPHLYGLLAAPRRVGIVPEYLGHAWWKNALSLASLHTRGTHQHVVVDRARLMSFFEKESTSPVLVPPAPETLPDSVLRFIEGTSYVVIHATPMWHYKRWPVARWQGLIEQIVAAGQRVVLTGSASPADRAINAEICGGLPQASRDNVLDLAGSLSLNQVTTLLMGARSFVGVDTSVTHQAAATGVPTVALFGPTTPVNFGPWPKEFPYQAIEDSPWRSLGQPNIDGARFQSIKNVMLIQGPGSCVPCLKAGCENKNTSRSECLEGLTEQVVLKMMRLAA